MRRRRRFTQRVVRATIATRITSTTTTNTPTAALESAKTDLGAEWVGPIVCPACSADDCVDGIDVGDVVKSCWSLAVTLSIVDSVVLVWVPLRDTVVVVELSVVLATVEEDGDADRMVLSDELDVVVDVKWTVSVGNGL